ncbi:hypothetical protein BDV33DRAFT_207245 [Aspergillus novoparasiticus]|uniref:Uncharacterized protein n=1 Tax=Aspergillus novoparasiticus TaxID=986946 RepID=A0A5N6EG59_9EURO|nr:hypothetical protein BDV33DRAFT_207245 [Aspergillus novoparasiticus]
MEQTIKVFREGNRALTTAGDALIIRIEQILPHDRNPSIGPDYELGEDIMARLDCFSYWKNWLFGLSSDAIWRLIYIINEARRAYATDVTRFPSGWYICGRYNALRKPRPWVHQFDKGLPETLHDKQMTVLDSAETILKTSIEKTKAHPTLYGCPAADT